MRKGGELESGMPPDNNQIAQRSVRGNQIPPIGRLSTDYLPAGTPETGYAFRGATKTTGQLLPLNVDPRPLASRRRAGRPRATGRALDILPDVQNPLL